MKTFEYSDITLIPTKFSSIRSRSEIDTSTDFLGVTLEVPIILAPMRDVVDAETAKSAFNAGGYAILHRFQSIDEQCFEYEQCPSEIACAVGVGENDIERVAALYSCGCRRFCIDVANGANYANLDFIKSIKNSSFPDIKIILGNFCSSEQLRTKALYQAVDAVRLGVAGGGFCKTRNATGIYHPMGSLIYDSRDYSQNYHLIADGGIKEPQDFCKALSLGANSVMAASIFVPCKDSPAETVTRFGKVYKVGSGSASEQIQKLYKTQTKYIEGTTKELEISNLTVSETIQRYKEGLQSSMSYFGARSLKQFQESSNFCFRH